jgi:hypothetical protein
MKVDIFRPIASTSVTAGAASAAAKLPGPGTAVRFANLDAANVVYVAFGFDTSIVATTSSLAIQPGTVELFSIDGDPAAGQLTGRSTGFTHYAYIAPVGTPVLNVATGEGC